MPFKPKFDGDSPFAAAIRRGIEATGGTHGNSPKLYYVWAADPPPDHDMAVLTVSKSTASAVTHWKRYFDDWKDWGVTRVRVRRIEPDMNKLGPIAWSDEFKEISLTVAKEGADAGS